MRYLYLLLFIGNIVRADTYATGMLGAFSTESGSKANNKFVNVGYRDYLGFGLTEQYEIGGWWDASGNGRKGSIYGAYQLGLEVDSFLLARFMVGPAFITSPDSYLGGAFPQFTEDLFFGLQGKNGNTLGVKYKHFSSAGIYQPNMGRDLLGVEISIPW